MIIIVKLKNYITNVCVHGIVISKFCHWLKPSLVVLFLIDKNPKISLHGAILPVSQTIYLSIKGGKKPSLNGQEVI